MFWLCSLSHGKSIWVRAEHSAMPEKCWPHDESLGIADWARWSFVFGTQSGEDQVVGVKGGGKSSGDLPQSFSKKEMQSGHYRKFAPQCSTLTGLWRKWQPESGVSMVGFSRQRFCHGRGVDSWLRVSAPHPLWCISNTSKHHQEFGHFLGYLLIDGGPDCKCGPAGI